MLSVLGRHPQPSWSVGFGGHERDDGSIAELADLRALTPHPPSLVLVLSFHLSHVFHGIMLIMDLPTNRPAPANRAFIYALDPTMHPSIPQLAPILPVSSAIE